MQQKAFSAFKKIQGLAKTYRNKDKDKEKEKEERVSGKTEDVEATQSLRVRKTGSENKRRKGRQAGKNENADAAVATKRLDVETSKRAKKKKKKQRTTEDPNLATVMGTVNAGGATKESAAPPPPPPAKPHEPIVDKGGFVSSLVEKGIAGQKKEFAEVKNDDKNKAFEASAFNDNLNRNRYKNVLCIESSRARLIDGYYNANIVDDRFIMAQAPMGCNVDKFWDVVVQEGVDVIVQLTAFEDPKCVAYFSPVGQQMDAGHWTLQMEPVVSEERQIVQHIMTVRCPAGEKEVRNIFWSEWPAGSVPDASNTIPFIWSLIKERRRILMLIKVQRQEEFKMDKMLVELRQKRHLAVRNELQYIFAGRVILFYFMKHNAAELSQSLLEYIDDYDAFVKKYGQEDKEKREKEGKPPANQLTELSNELIC